MSLTPISDHTPFSDRYCIGPDRYPIVVQRDDAGRGLVLRHAERRGERSDHGPQARGAWGRGGAGSDRTRTPGARAGGNAGPGHKNHRLHEARGRVIAPPARAGSTPPPEGVERAPTSATRASRGQAGSRVGAALYRKPAPGSGQWRSWPALLVGEVPTAGGVSLARTRHGPPEEPETVSRDLPALVARRGAASPPITGGCSLQGMLARRARHCSGEPLPGWRGRPRVPARGRPEAVRSLTNGVCPVDLEEWLPAGSLTRDRRSRRRRVDLLRGRRDARAEAEVARAVGRDAGREATLAQRLEERERLLGGLHAHDAAAERRVGRGDHADGGDLGQRRLELGGLGDRSLVDRLLADVEVEAERVGEGPPVLEGVVAAGRERHAARPCARGRCRRSNPGSWRLRTAGSRGPWPSTLARWPRRSPCRAVRTATCGCRPPARRTRDRGAPRAPRRGRARRRRRAGAARRRRRRAHRRWRAPGASRQCSSASR